MNTKTNLRAVLAAVYLTAAVLFFSLLLGSAASFHADQPASGERAHVLSSVKVRVGKGEEASLSLPATLGGLPAGTSVTVTFQVPAEDDALFFGTV